MTAEQFRAWRKALGLSQQAVADAFGMSRRTISAYECGEYPIPPIVAVACEGLTGRLAEVLP